MTLQQLRELAGITLALLAEQLQGLPRMVGIGAGGLAVFCIFCAVVRGLWGRRAVVRLRRSLLVLGLAAALLWAGRALVPTAAPADDWFAALTVQELPDPPELQAEAALLIDVTEGQILYQKNTADPIAPASTAKLLTALTVWQLCSADEWVTVGNEQGQVAFDASVAGLQQGDRLTVRDLTAAMLLPSGNDAAYALAAHAGRAIAGQAADTDVALNAFRKAMDQTARQLRANSSRFVRPDGYDADHQHTTVQDLARIAHAFAQNQELAALAASPAMTVTTEGGRTLELTNTNLLLQPTGEYYHPAVTGLKTGRTTAAGSCLITTAAQNGRQYLCLVMHSTEQGRWADTLALLAAAETFAAK